MAAPYRLTWLRSATSKSARFGAASPTYLCERFCTSSTNGICERFHKTVLNEFYRVAFRKQVYRSIDELQADLDLWMREYNEQRPHQGRWCFGKTPMQTFLDAMPMAKEKMIAA
jgi:transposase InsO family protein